MLRAVDDPRTPDDTRREENSSPPRQMAMMEGVGSLCIIGGALAVLGTIPNPAMVWTFAPVAAVGIAIGLLLIRISRASMS